MATLNAVGVERDLLNHYGRKLDAVTLQTGHGGLFKIFVDGQLVTDAAIDGLDMPKVTDAIEHRLAA